MQLNPLNPHCDFICIFILYKAFNLFSPHSYRTAVAKPDHHHHHHHTCYKDRSPSCTFFPDPSSSQLQPLTNYLLLCGPLCVSPPRLRSGRRLPPPGVGARSWEMDSTNRWKMMLRASGPLTLSRASRRHWPSTHRVAAGRSSSLMRARCTVRPLLSSFD